MLLILAQLADVVSSLVDHVGQQQVGLRLLGKVGLDVSEQVLKRQGFLSAFILVRNGTKNGLYD